MTDEQISRVIAEFLEPFATLPPAPEPPVVDGTFYSQHQAWICVCDYESGDIPAWKPRDFVNGPACTLMLMQQRGFIGVVRKPGRLHVGEYAATFNGAVSRWAKSIGRAVAEAFCAANGLGESQ